LLYIQLMRDWRLTFLQAQILAWATLRGVDSSTPPLLLQRVPSSRYFRQNTVRVFVPSP
jgi:hypothetical protein